MKIAHKLCIKPTQFTKLQTFERIESIKQIKKDVAMRHTYVPPIRHLM